MTGNERPIYIVRYLDQFVKLSGAPENSVMAFGTEEEAKSFAVECAHDRGVHPSLYRIVEFIFSGKVSEA